MSQHPRPKLIIEWAPGNVLAFQPGTGTVRKGETVSAATSGLPTSDVLVTLSRRASFVRTTRVPNAGHAEINLILMNQLANLFPISGKDLAYDFQLTDNVTGEGRLALVGAVQSDLLRQLQTECKNAGVKISAIMPASIGAAELLRSRGVQDAAVAQVDDQGASIDIVVGGVLRYSRWTAATRDVPAEVRRTFAAAGVETLPVLAAGGLSLPADYHASESTLVALGNVDLSKPPLDIELLEVKMAREAKARANALRLSGLVLVAGIAVLAWIGMENFDARKKVSTAVEGQISQINDQKKIDDKSVTELNDSQARLGVIKRGFEPPQKAYEILAKLTNLAPPGVWLTNFSFERGRPMIVRGFGMTADLTSAYSQRLAQDPRFRDVQLQYSNQTAIDNRSVSQFSITGFPVGNLPLVDKTTGAGSSSSTTSSSTGGTA